jgi:hypothetical protein
VVAVALVGGLFALASPGTAITDDEGVLASLVNGARSSAGLPPMAVSGALSDVARQHSASMASAGSISHTGSLTGVVGAVVPDWTSVGENVAVSGSVTEAHNALMASATHRANVLGDFNVLGVGVVRSGDGRVWVTELFAKTPTMVVEPPPPPAPEPVLAPVDTTVVSPVLLSQPETLPAPTAPKAAKVRPAKVRTAKARPQQPPAAPRRPAAQQAPADGSCLPEQAQPQGQGHAYGRCDQVPQGQGAAGRRP